MVCSLHNYDFMWKNRHFFAKNEWKEVPLWISLTNFRDLTKTNWSHLTPPFYFKHDEKNYSFQCSRCNESIGSTFETKNNIFTNYYIHDIHAPEIKTYMNIDDYFCAFMANNQEWFALHNKNYLSLDNPLCLCK